MSTTATQAPTIIRYEDHEGDGRCGHCGREGLRWIAVLSDGATVGTECAKKVTGMKPLAASKLAWLADFELVAEHVDCGAVMGLWQHKRGAATRETRNGHLVAVGGVRAEWVKAGWIAA